LQLSQAPPEFELEIANYTEETMAPGNNPATAFSPNRYPNIKGAKMTKHPGAIISLNDACVDILIQALKSGSLVPFLISSSLSYFLTSLTMSIAALPTLCIVIAENQ